MKRDIIARTGINGLSKKSQHSSPYMTGSNGCKNTPIETNNKKSNTSTGVDEK
jgi:hypothetical protein